MTTKREELLAQRADAQQTRREAFHALMHEPFATRELLIASIEAATKHIAEIDVELATEA